MDRWSNSGEKSQRRERIRREQVREERVRKKKITARKGRKVVKHSVSQCFVAPAGCRLAKAAAAEPSGPMKDMKKSMK